MAMTCKHPAKRKKKVASQGGVAPFGRGRQQRDMQRDEGEATSAPFNDVFSNRNLLELITRYTVGLDALVALMRVCRTSTLSD